MYVLNSVISSEAYRCDGTGAAYLQSLVGPLQLWKLRAGRLHLCCCAADSRLKSFHLFARAHTHKNTHIYKQWILWHLHQLTFASWVLFSGFSNVLSCLTLALNHFSSSNLFFDITASYCSLISSRTLDRSTESVLSTSTLTLPLCWSLARRISCNMRKSHNLPPPADGAIVLAKPNSFKQDIPLQLSGSSHLLVVALQVDQLLFQTLYLHLQVTDVQSQAVPDPSETSHVSLNVRTHAQLCLIPTEERIKWGKDEIWTINYTSGWINARCSVKQQRNVNLLHSEVLCGQLSVVDLQVEALILWEPSPDLKGGMKQ